MTGKLRAAGLVWPAVIAMVGVVSLIALGNWQWQRMHWKAGLLSQLEQVKKAVTPLILETVPTRGAPDDALKKLRFRRVTVKGQFEHDREMHVWAPGAKPAWSVVTPLRLAPSAEVTDASLKDQASHVFVIRGVVPDDQKAQRLREPGQLAGEVSVTGRVRLDQPNSWANAPDVSKNQWFTRDVEAMSAYQRALPAGGKMTFAPFFIEVEAQMGGPLAPKPDLRALTLSNKHLEYALTWWGLAATLLVVFAIFAWGRIGEGRLPDER